MKVETAPVRLSDYRAPEFLIDTVKLDIRLDAERTRVTATLSLRRNGDGAAALTLQGDELRLTGLALDGMPVSEDRYEATPERLVIANVPDRPFVLEIVTELNPVANTKLMGLYRSGSVYCTQCEAEGFRRITYFLDRPDVLSVYTTRIEAAKAEAPVLLSNGNPLEHGDLAAGRHYRSEEHTSELQSRRD